MPPDWKAAEASVGARKASVTSDGSMPACFNAPSVTKCAMLPRVVGEMVLPLRSANVLIGLSLGRMIEVPRPPLVKAAAILTFDPPAMALTAGLSEDMPMSMASAFSASCRLTAAG